MFTNGTQKICLAPPVLSSLTVKKDQKGAAGLKSLRAFALLGAGVSGLLSFATIASADEAEHGLRVSKLSVASPRHSQFIRPRIITLCRTWRKMPLWHKTKLLYSLVFQAVFLPSPEHLNQMLKDMDDVDMLTLVIQEMSKEFPTVMETLVHERDKQSLC